MVADSTGVLQGAVKRLHEQPQQVSYPSINFTAFLSLSHQSGEGICPRLIRVMSGAGFWPSYKSGKR